MSFKRVSYRYLTDASLEALKANFSDSEISLESVLWWVKITVNKVKAKSIPKTESGSYLATFTDLPTKFQYDGANNLLRNKKYIELPENIFDLNRDGGVDWLAYSKVIKDENGKVCYCEPIYFQRTTLIEAREMQFNPYEKATEDNPYFIRINNLLYLPGIEDTQNIKLDGAFFITESPYINDISLDDEVFLNDEQIQEVLVAVLSLGRFVILIPEEQVEDGADTRTVPAYKQLAASPDIPVAQTQDQNQQAE